MQQRWLIWWNTFLRNESYCFLHLFLNQTFYDIRLRIDECTLKDAPGAIIYYVCKSRTFNSFLSYWMWQKQIKTVFSVEGSSNGVHTSYLTICIWHQKKSNYSNNLFRTWYIPDLQLLNYDLEYDVKTMNWIIM